MTRHYDTVMPTQHSEGVHLFNITRRTVSAGLAMNGYNLLPKFSAPNWPDIRLD